MSRGKRDENERTRVGICCGKRCLALAEKRGYSPDVALYRVWPIFRFRCAACYKREVGSNP